MVVRQQRNGHINRQLMGTDTVVMKVIAAMKSDDPVKAVLYTYNTCRKLMVPELSL